MNKIETVNERNVGIDLFRFISMFMVICLHLLGHGGLLFKGHSIIDKAAVLFLESLCIIAVNCFALISGFVNQNKKFTIKRVLNLWVQVFFLNALISCLFYVLQYEAFTWKSLLYIIFPVMSYSYWYFTYYFMILLLMPLLNLIIDKANKTCILSILAFIGVLIGITAFFTSRVTLFDFSNGYTVSWLAYLYLVGGVVNKYKLRIKKFDNHNWLYLLLYVVIAGVSVLVSFGASLIYSHTMFYYTNLFNIINCVILLMFFANMKIKGNKLISFLSATSFGVYLIHEQPFVRAHIITNSLAGLGDSNFLVIYAFVILSAVAIYFICSILEYLRQKLFKLLRVNKVIDKINLKCSEKYAKISEKIEGANQQNEQ